MSMRSRAGQTANPKASKAKPAGAAIAPMHRSTPAHNAAINAAMKDPAVQQRLKTAGLDTVGGTPDEFDKLIADDNAKWGPIIKRSGAKLD